MSDFYIFRATLRDLTRPGRLLIAALLVALPALVVALIRSQTPTEVFNPAEAYNWFETYIVWNFILVLLGIVFETGLIAQEVERKTIVYLLTRPVPRWRILLMKHCAAVLAVLFTAWIATLLLAAVCFGTGGVTKSPVLKREQIKDEKALATQLQETPNGALIRLHEMLRGETKRALDNYETDKSPSNELMSLLIGDLNNVITHGERSRFRRRGDLYDAQAFGDVPLSANTQALIAMKDENRVGPALNRALIQDLFPGIIGPPGETTAHVSRDLLIMPIGALAYGTLFLLIGTILLRPQIAALLYAFGWELLVPQLPGDFQKGSLAAYLRVLAPHPTLATEAQSASLFGSAEKVVISMPLAWSALTFAIAASLVAALFIFSVREYVPRDDA